MYRGWGEFLLVTVQSQDYAIERQVDHHGDAVCVLPFDPDRRTVMLVRQLRVPLLYRGADPFPLEPPAGRLEDINAESEARREVEEEVGLRLTDLEFIASLWSGAAFTTERLHLYLGRYSQEDRVGAGGGLASESELVEVIEMPVAEAMAIVDDGRDVDMKLHVCLNALRRRYPQLFHAGLV